MSLDLHVERQSPHEITVGYSCPCGCRPSVQYLRGAPPVTDVCCCGNQFAVGIDAAGHLESQPGFHAQQEPIDAPWSEPIQAAWLIGQSLHADHD